MSLRYEEGMASAPQPGQLVLPRIPTDKDSHLQPPISLAGALVPFRPSLSGLQGGDEKARRATEDRQATPLRPAPYYQ